MRKRFLRTSLEIWDVFNLRTFHHGYKCSIIAGLRLVVMTYQSFNTDRLDEREKEIANVFAAMREARKKFTNSKKTRLQKR